MKIINQFGQNSWSWTIALIFVSLFVTAPTFAVQKFRNKNVYFGDAHWHSCLSQDAKRESTLTGQYQSMLYDYGLDFSLQSEHAEAAEAGILYCDSYLPRRFDNTSQHRPIPYGGEAIATAMKRAADDWNGKAKGNINFVTFPGYEWAPDARCWKASPANIKPSSFDDTNANHKTPGHINYFFSDTTGWSYGPDVWEPGDGDSGTCATGTALGLTYYSGSRDWTDEILGQLIHQRDDPNRRYDLLIQYNHPAATRDKGGFPDHLAKWYDHEHSKDTCSVKPGGVPCTSQNQCETFRRAYGVNSVEWYANQEASIGSTETHPYSPTDSQCRYYLFPNTNGPKVCAAREAELHRKYHLPGRFVASRGLQEGYNLAFFGGSDSHNGRKNKPTGFPNGDRGAGARSLTAVYANAATRPAIWDGLTHKRTYTLSRFREIGPVHKGRVNFFSSTPDGEVGMGELGATSPMGSNRNFTISAAAAEGTSGIFPTELRLYVVGTRTQLSYRTDIDHYWLDDEPNDLGKLGVLLGKAINSSAAGEFSHTFTNIRVNPGDAVFAIVIYSDDVWVDDYYNKSGQPLTTKGGIPARHDNNNTWARTTPIWFYAANEKAQQISSCSKIGFAGSSYAVNPAAGGGDTGVPGDKNILPVAQKAGYKLEWNQWMINVPADYKYADLSFFTQKDEDNIGHLFAVRVDGQLLYSGRAGINHKADTLVQKKNLLFPLKKGLHKVEVHMDDQEFTEEDDNYHCNDYDGPPGYVDAIVFHNVTTESCDTGVNLPPAVRITSPASNASINLNEAMMLNGEASDPENATPLTYQWTVKLNDSAPIVVGSQPSVLWKPSDTYNFNGEGSYKLEIRLNVTDPQGKTGTDFKVFEFSIIL